MIGTPTPSFWKQPYEPASPQPCGMQPTANKPLLMTKNCPQLQQSEVVIGSLQLEYWALPKYPTKMMVLVVDGSITEA